MTTNEKTNTATALAFDLGASNGKALIGQISNGVLTLRTFIVLIMGHRLWTANGERGSAWQSSSLS